MTTVKFGRLAHLVTTKAESFDFKVGLEAIESETGRLIPTDSEYSGDGASFEPGDVLFGKLRPYLAKSWLADRAGSAVGDFHVYRVDAAQADPRFLQYVTLSRAFLDPVISSVYGAKMPRASWSFIRDVEVWGPMLMLQQAIADYLDRETAQIDTLIAKQSDLITSLKDRRQAVIASMALGDYSPLAAVPRSSTPVGAHFSVVLGKMLDAGKSPNAADMVLPYVRAANIQDGGLDLTSTNEMPYSLAEASRLDLRKDDLLVVEGGAVGTAVLIDADMPGWSFQKTVNRVRSTGAASTAWLGYVLRAYRDAGVIDIICDGSTIAHFTAEKLRALRVPAIDPSRQREIATQLDSQTSKIDFLISKAEQFIALAKERRAALITAAVTGQLDVSTAA